MLQLVEMDLVVSKVCPYGCLNSNKLYVICFLNKMYISIATSCCEINVKA